MVRKTKAEAEQTRQQIMDAARQVFHECGVARTSLEQVAQAAGVTRGAVYWHFANKIDLFFAMRDQTSLPLVDRVDPLLLSEDLDDALLGIELGLKEIFNVIGQCEEVQQKFEIMFFRCEYVGDFAAILQQTCSGHQDFVDKLSLAYQRAGRQGVLRPGFEPLLLARDTAIFISGLLRSWLANSEPDIRATTPARIEAHIALRRA